MRKTEEFTPEGQHVISDTEAEAISWFFSLGSAVDQGFALNIKDGKLVGIDEQPLETIVNRYIWSHPERFGHAGIGEGEADTALVNEISLDLLGIAKFKRQSALRSMHWTAKDRGQEDRVIAIEKLADDLGIKL